MHARRVTRENVRVEKRRRVFCPLPHWYRPFSFFFFEIFHALLLSYRVRDGQYACTRDKNWRGSACAPSSTETGDIYDPQPRRVIHYNSDICVDARLNIIIYVIIIGIRKSQDPCSPSFLLCAIVSVDVRGRSVASMNSNTAQRRLGGTSIIDFAT